MHSRPIFFAFSALNINFKGVHMKLKIVGLEISVEYLIEIAKNRKTEY